MSFSVRSLLAASAAHSSVPSASSAPTSSASVFWSRAPVGVLVWPPSFDAYLRASAGLVPFVFVGVRHPDSHVVSGVLLVNVDLADEQLWSKLVLEIVPGRALAVLDVAANLLKYPKFPEVDMSAICIHGVQKGGGVLLEEACAAELLAISPAWKKYHLVSCSVVQEVGIAIQTIMSKHMSFVGSSFSRASFVEYFLSQLYENKPQDLVFVLKKPVGRPLATLAK